ncbi:DegT/DnrJ/EryC1/StrS family aminotransferase, partial [Streptomyces coeruleorubidus]|uniref:DegT/DnrJ/EryC1/StrS family aminotransferase n=1 Tax=Streptomyces coeruleorubidus TaxID=116188 RepID=UPI0037B9320A
LVLIEDAANAVASRAEGTACGAFGDLAVWSFDAMKILITGDGGMLHVRDPKAARRARRLAYHGLEQASGFSKAGRVPSRWWELNVQDFGRRQLGNDVTAAIGSVQLRRLPEFVERRRRIAALYDDLLAGVPGVRTPPPLPEGHNSSYYFYWVQVDAAIRDQIAADLLRQGIYTTFRYPPLHKVPAYGPYAGADLIGTEQAAETTLLLPIHQALTDGDVHTIVTALETSVAEHEAARA